jgi:RNA polymerase sigma-70 factor, ECF subfamily
VTVIKSAATGHPHASDLLQRPLSLDSPLSTPTRFDVDEARLGRVVTDCFEPTWRFLRRLGVPESDVDDAIQEVILVLARKLQQVEAGKERSFMMSTAYRVASDLRKKAKRRREVPESPLLEVATEALDPEASAEQRRMAQLLDSALEQVPIDIRAVFVLYEVEGFTMAEIARDLSLAPGTVASRLRRGRELFEEIAAQLLPEEGAS